MSKLLNSKFGLILHFIICFVVLSFIVQNQGKIKVDSTKTAYSVGDKVHSGIINFLKK